jgi:two-component system response regulator AlgR
VTDAQTLRVLVVDDSRAAQSQIRKLCATHSNVEVVGTAFNGAEAIRIVKQTQPDLVFMDLVMPDVDGIVALRMLCKGMPGIRVAVISSLGGSARTAEEAFKLGAIDVLAKPVDPAALGRLVDAERQRTLEGARAES